MSTNEKISADPIDVMALFHAARNPYSGAIVFFSGDARIQISKIVDKEVAFLTYEAQIVIAKQFIETILAEAIEKYQLKFAEAVHRIGKVGISESAVCVVTASPHRKEAYLANQYIIHKIKHEAPIWKKEVFTDGSYLWGGNCNCTPGKHEEFAA